MIWNFIKRMWLPLLCCGLTATGAVLLTGQFGDPMEPSLDELRQLSVYALHVGLWLCGAWGVNRLIGIVVWDGVASRWFNGSVPRLLRDVTALLVLMLAVTGIVAFVFQKSVAGIWATSGAVGILLGIALKDVILDVFTGLAMNVDRPFSLGDWIRLHESGVDGAIGQVTQISWRTTRLRTEENMLVVIPNSRFGQLVVTNYSAPTEPTRFEVLFDIEYWIPVERVRRVLLAALWEAQMTDGFVTEPPPNVLFQQTNNCGFQYRLQYWIKPWQPFAPNRAKDIVQRLAIKHLQCAGIPVAFPKQELAIRQVADATVMDPLVDRRRLLSHVPLFRDLPPSELTFLAEKMQLHAFRRGETLIHQGDSGDSMFLLWEGLLGIYVDLRNNGQPIRVAQIAPGEFFGEISLLTGEARSATVRTECDCSVFEITKNCMTELFRQHPQLLDSISRIVAERRVENDRYQVTIAEAEKQRQTDSIAQQFKERIRGFFRGILSQ